MSCHISALCITLPFLKRGLVETTLGRGIHGGWRRQTSRPLQSTNLRGTPLRRAPSTTLPSLSQRRGSSALIPPQVYVEETLNTQKALRRPIFRSVWLHSRSVLPEDQITDQKTVLCCTSRVPARLRKAAHPTRLGHIFCWSCDHRKPRINCLSPSCIVAPKKCI